MAAAGPESDRKTVRSSMRRISNAARGRREHTRRGRCLDSNHVADTLTPFQLFASS